MATSMHCIEKSSISNKSEDTNHNISSNNSSDSNNGLNNQNNQKTTTTTITPTNLDMNSSNLLTDISSNSCSKSDLNFATTKATTTITNIDQVNNSNMTTKIPLRNENVNQNKLQRCSSLRVRGQRANLLYQQIDENLGYYYSDRPLETEHGRMREFHLNNSRVSRQQQQRRRGSNAEYETPVMKQQQHNHQTKDPSVASSCGSTHKFLYNTSTSSLNRRFVTTTSQNSTKDGLTRSLSLRRNHKFNSKTDAKSDEGHNVETETRLMTTMMKAEHEDAEGVKAKSNLECNGCQENDNRIGNDTTDNENQINCLNGIMEAKESSNLENCMKDKKSLSLNLDGLASTTAAAAASETAKATTTSTTKISISNGLATETVSSTKTNATHTKESPLATHVNGPSAQTTSAAITSKSPAVTTPRTPRTPTTPLLNHRKHQALTSVPESHSTAVTVPRKLTPKTPPVTPDSPATYLDDDLDSIYSFATTTSGRSTMSCEHPYVARNGTTFSGRKMKYVVHCSNYAGQVGSDYLTPTQRAQRHIRRLKELLCIARSELEQKDSEILRLTREVVELRLFKASLNSPDERSASSDAVTVREAELKTSQDVSPIVDTVDDMTKSSPRHIPGAHHHHHQLHQQSLMQLSSEMQSSFADSGHFEDMTSMSIHSKDSYANTQDIACGSDEAVGVDGEHSSSAELQRQDLIRLYEQRIEELIRNQDAATSEMKRSHNDKVEALLLKLSECNTRYADIVPDYELAKERIRELEKQLEDLQRKLIEHEEKQNKLYLHMYQKGQEAERIVQADQALESAYRATPNKVSINELLQQLQSTQDELENIRAAECRKECGSNHALLTAKEAISLWVLGARKTIYRRLLEAQKTRTHVDPEITLQFLKSAVYYFLTDKENSQGHLQAIESILEFTEAEKQNISKARGTSK